MSQTRSDPNSALWSLRRMLPLKARGRRTLTAFLRQRGMIGDASHSLTVTNIFRAGDGALMCQFAVAGDAGATRTFVAPLAQLALSRSHPISRNLAALAARGRARPKE